MAKTIVFLGSSVTCGGDGYSMTEYVNKTLKWEVK